MKSTKTVWLLLAKKFAGEATDRELIELSEIGKIIPAFERKLQLLSTIWESFNAVEEWKKDEECEAAYEKHCRRMGNLSSTGILE